MTYRRGFHGNRSAATISAVPTPLSQRLGLTALRLLPRNLLSRAAGAFASLRWPGPLQRAEIRAFGRLAGVDFTEVRDPLESFGSLQEFFTRALREGARPIDPASDAFVAPCDGAWGQSGRVERGLLLQLKGRPYSLGALLGDNTLATAFDGGTFATFYLSPRDYHRFHAPCRMRVRSAVYLPGTLWPVNRAGVEGIDGLFAQNERICAFSEALDGDGAPLPGRLVLVAVGATMVGKVRLVFDTLSTNVRGAELTRCEYAPPVELAPGAEWGRFEFGSTIVAVATPGLVALDTQPLGTPLRLGRRIGTLPGR